jgi:2-oxoisovalerate dehydrogenase E1 component beta subunit
MVWESIAAADELGAEGVSVEVLDLRSLMPYDQDAILQTAHKTGRILVLHEATLTYGPGAEIAAFVASEAFEFLDAPVRRLASLDTPVPYSLPLEKYFMPNSEKIAAAIRQLAAY